jgi:hypothetical protein
MIELAGSSGRVVASTATEDVSDIETPAEAVIEAVAPVEDASDMETPAEEVPVGARGMQGPAEAMSTAPERAKAAKVTKRIMSGKASAKQIN